MRNASEQDLGVGSWNVYAMYQVEHPWYGKLLAHIKERVRIGYKNMLAMETHDGCPILAEYKWLRAVPRKEGSKPKAKHIHMKGTCPWLAKFEYVDYDPKLIAPGVKVKCRDKKVRVVRAITQKYDGSFSIDFMREYISGVDLESGLANYVCKSSYPSDIMKILVEKKIEKPINDKYCGYATNVWHFWQGTSNVPPVNGDVVVAIWCRGEATNNNAEDTAADADYWYWGWDNCDSDIIAFKIIS